MSMLSERAREIDAYIKLHPDKLVGKWPVEIGGKLKRLDYYTLPIKLLRYNVKNGRLAMEVREWQAENKRELDPSQPGDIDVIRKLLLGLNKEETESLKRDIDAMGQEEPGVITADGYVINGNRRMAVIQQLHSERPTGRWLSLDVIVLKPDIAEPDLWKIEAGLQLSKSKVAEYHPVNELLKIKEGMDAGLTSDEIAAAMYGRTKDYVVESMERLALIDSFLEFMAQQGNYGLIKKHGYHEYFVDLQKKVVAPAKKAGLSARDRAKQLASVWPLFKADIDLKAAATKTKGITHWDVRKLGDIFDDARAKAAYLEPLSGHTKPSPASLMEGFRNAAEEIDLRRERGQPLKLVERATRALERIDCKSSHCQSPPVRAALSKLDGLVKSLLSELDVK